MAYVRSPVRTTQCGTNLEQGLETHAVEWTAQVKHFVEQYSKGPKVAWGAVWRPGRSLCATRSSDVSYRHVDKYEDKHSAKVPQVATSSPYVCPGSPVLADPGS